MPHLFGDKLRKLRRARGMTQTDLAHQLGLATHAQISHLETGRSAPSLDVAVRVADLFGITTDYVLRDTIPSDRPTSIPAQSQATHTLPQQFGVRLRQLRKQRDLTQVDLAGRLGDLSQAAVSAFERGDKAPSIAIVLQCADLFGVSTDELLRDIA
jgi:transcriptional regulator with XRE-family HTH domain